MAKIVTVITIYCDVDNCNSELETRIDDERQFKTATRA